MTLSFPLTEVRVHGDSVEGRAQMLMRELGRGQTSGTGRSVFKSVSLLAQCGGGPPPAIKN